VEPTEGEMKIAYSIGDYYPDPTDPETAIGVVFWVDPKDNRHGKIVHPIENSCSWGPVKDIFYTSMYNGVVNMNRVWSVMFSFQSHPPFKFAWAFNENSSNGNIYANATTGIWYLPALEELSALAAGFSGLVYENIAGWSYDMPGYNSNASLDFRKAFNSKLKEIGGHELASINAGSDHYWSSSENGSEKAHYVTMPNGSKHSTSKLQKIKVRAIMAF
ncbi:hypothetical protein LJC21_04815, partial [Bacteroides sp. OttesenSCG-928-E20]|nr:hypothetical protein [Bacteroides sp. OttesenSCG-928-E20]